MSPGTVSQRDEALALELLEKHRGILRDLFPKYQGTEIKTIGDGFLVEFARALAVMRCCGGNPADIGGAKPDSAPRTAGAHRHWYPPG
jgi:class 3 adenylate cyclase